MSTVFFVVGVLALGLGYPLAFFILMLLGMAIEWKLL